MTSPTTDPGAERREQHPERPKPPRPGDVQLVIAVLAGPLAWALAEVASYSLAPTACWLGHPLVLYLVPLGPLLVVLAGAGLAWRRWRRQAGEPGEPAGSTEKGDPGDSRARFMALAGFWLCLGFALAIVAFGLPPLLLKVCD
jgi:hypothetical protein